jgi:type 1 glutamine amidotransferase
MGKLLYFFILIGSCISFLLNAYPSFSQIKILHYTETSGFNHNTRMVSKYMFQQLSIQLGFMMDDDSTGNSFDSISTLNQYDVIIFSNTSGASILDSTQRINFEQYIANGGNVIGIHAASDTYRHSAANGGNTGVWDFWPELIGASVQENPNHVAGTPIYSMHSQQSHILLDAIPDPWSKAEEYYYWEMGYFDHTNNKILLNVEQTIGPNGLVNSYDSMRATTWYRETLTGNKIFYTSLGHDASNFTTDTIFYTLIKNALLWTTGANPGIDKYTNTNFKVYPNPFSDKLYIQTKSEIQLKILSITGNQIIVRRINEFTELDCNIPPGIYILEMQSSSGIQYQLLISE